jgi:hypothetical protein
MELHEALRRCYEKRPFSGRTLNQEDIAEEVTRRYRKAGLDRTMSQAMVSNYTLGKSDNPPPLLVSVMEELAGRAPGWVYIQAGLVRLPQTLEERIDMDTEIGDEFKPALKTMVRALKEESRAARPSSGGRQRRAAAG